MKDKLKHLIILLGLSVVPGFAQDSADVIVYGSTPGGFCAAIAAAREGASVILLEPTEHVGGLSTGGLSHCDSNQMRRETLMGLFDEWHRRVVKDYTGRGLPAPYDPALKDTAKWTFEPHVAMRVTLAMLKESGVAVKTGRYLQSVTKDGPRITSLVTKDGTFKAKVFVDGSYEGDLMAAAGVDWTIGREGRAEFGESYAGKQYPKKKMDISGFDDAGNLLPLATTSDAGPEEAGDKNIMTYSFRLCLTRDPARMVPMPAPANYAPARFELARRALKVGATVGLDLYPLPGGKLDGNNSIGGQISLGLVGGCNTWHSADEAGRRTIWEAHKQYTLEFLHFLRTDPAVPQKVRGQFAGLGLCKDEFAATAHFPPALYVRESRRMKGLHVLSQKDIIGSPEKEDPVAISSFPIDSHDCQRVALKDGGVINEGTIFPVRVPGTGVGYAYHVPYRSVLPKAGQCTNLLVPVALSCTHVVMSSLRIEGAWMVIGQGAGVAAALAAKQNIAVQNVPHPILRERLLAQGQVLALPATLKTPAEKKPTAGKPNVLLIAIDDLNDWVGCLGGHPQALTPNIDRLARRGVLFTNAHCQAPLCNPSRTSILYGLRPSNSGIYDNETKPWTVPALKQRVTLPRHFAANGYRTLTTGKIYHDSGMPPDDFQVVGPVPGQRNKHDARRIPETPDGARGLWDFGPQNYDETLFQDHADATWAIERLRESSVAPFFLTVGFYRPHVPLYAPARFFDQIPEAEIVLPIVKENDRDDLPPVIKELIASRHSPSHDWFVKTNHWRKAVQAYLACIRFADEQVGRVLDALEASPHAKNTIVVLYSDHGFFLGEKEHWAKQSLWERATRVPLIISAPGFTQGQSCPRPAELLGIYPTLIDLCGLTKRHDIDGTSLVPLLENPQAEWSRPALTTHGHNNHTVRNGRFRYIRYYDGSEELYDHQSDSHEWTNLAARPEHAALRKELAAWLPKTNVPPAKAGKNARNEAK